MNPSKDLIARLNKACDLKVWKGQTERCEQLLRECWDLAQTAASPWKQLTAYRLAHVLLRNGDLSPIKLQEIDWLLAVATEEKRLGPLPSIYRLAVLHRLGENCDTVWNEAKLSIRQRQRTHSPEQMHQDIDHNLLELAGYFLGRPYEGNLTSPWSDLFAHRSGWLVVGKEIRCSSELVCRELAEAEFHHLAEQHQGTVQFILTATKSLLNDQPIQAKPLALLTHILAHPAESRSDRQRRMHLDNSEAHRQCLSGLRRALREAVGREVDPENPDIPILGLVEKNRLDELTRNSRSPA